MNYKKLRKFNIFEKKKIKKVIEQAMTKIESFTGN